jgi:hypothetical protein
MFGRPFTSALQAAFGGHIPGAIIEEVDPRLLAQIISAPVPASGDFQPGGQPQDQGYEQPATNYGGGLPPQPLPQLPPQENGMPASARQAAGYPPPSATRPPQPMWGDDPAAPKKKKNPVGQFFKHWAGFAGDALTGNPVYAHHRQNNAKLKA